LIIISCADNPSVESSTIDLSGSWRFALDEKKEGYDAKWYTTILEDEVQLPGTTDENQKGLFREEAPIDRLARVWYWKGAAWYQRDIVIPLSWQDKRITLNLERTKHTRVWVDDTFCGWDDSLSAPHVYDVTEAMTPGKRTITLLIDNSILPPVGPSHAVDERTQTNWNGVVGKMELHATDPVWIEQIQVYPDIKKNEVRVRAEIGNATGEPASGKLTISCATTHTDSPTSFKGIEMGFTAEGERSWVEFTYSPENVLPLWDEFNTTLIELTAVLEAEAAGQSYAHREAVRFGMREFAREGNQLVVNGRPVFLRGRVDCANYPLTGYAPMDKASWDHIFTILSDWGLNHVRFHSWCPPEAAFEAADELGFYLQPELPNKRSGFKAPENEDAAYHNIDRLAVNESSDKVSLFDYGMREGERIFRHYGNSPSFTMFTLGNELGRNEGMFELVRHFQKANPRALHAQGSNNMHWNPSLAEGDDFWVTAKVSKTLPLRGAFYIHDNPEGYIDNSPPSTMVDFSESLNGVPVPLIGHETGAFQVSPDFGEIPKFTGVLRAKNYEIFRDRLEKAGMLDQADDFVRASGALAAICYREDIEAALRTPQMGGFQLLDIMDFPGQGTAPVGMLNVFMEEKGVIDPKTWREFCSEIVPLIRMSKYTWTDRETFRGRIQVAQYGPQDLIGAVLAVEVIDESGNVIAGKEFNTNLPRGGLVDVGEYALGFGCLEPDWPQRLDVVLTIPGTPYRNTTPIWIYPAEVDLMVPEGVLVSRSFKDPATRKHLQNGGKVLLLPKLDSLPHSVPGSFQTDYWSPMFAQSAIKRGLEPPPGTLGILCDPATPVLKHFPTEFHSNWQWWHLVKQSRPIILDETPDDYRPMVQVIDNFARNHKLGLVMETKVGKGSMLICSIDLPGMPDEPAARQLMNSLLNYIGSPDFAPKKEIELKVLEKLLPN
jgi:hypothetical protein